MGPNVLKFCSMIRWRFLKPSSFQKLYRLTTPFFQSPGISLNGRMMLLLSGYACRITGMLLLLRMPEATGSSMQDRGSATVLRHILNLAISATNHSQYQQLLWLTCFLPLKQGCRRLVHKVSPPFCTDQGSSALNNRTHQQYTVSNDDTEQQRQNNLWFKSFFKLN